MKRSTLVLLLLAVPAGAQTYQAAPSRVPQGSPFNNSYSENVDFADVDGDGDWDAVFADGGSFGNDRNRIWINQGGLQGASAGYYVDETLTRYVNLGVNNGTTILSSIPSAILFPSGGYINYSCDSDFADVDADGHIDLMLSSYGGVAGGNKPSRIFLNRGDGTFEEFNPSGFQLLDENLLPGNPGLWCQGLQEDDTTSTNGSACDISTTAIDVDLGDLDGDLDVDILLGARNEEPRYFANLLEEDGALGFRDSTHAVFPAGYTVNIGHYEQELGDLDGDDDLDIYGVDWLVGSQLHDSLLMNDGSGVFASMGALAGPTRDHQEADFVDLDGDGDLDVIAATFSGQEDAYQNDGSGQLTSTTATHLPVDTSQSLDVDACDLDGDGDFDLMVANDANQANVLLDNTSGVADTHAPRLARLEQAPDRSTSAVPTRIRVQAYDNVPAYLLWYETTTLEYFVNGGPLRAVAMTPMGGQLFRGEIPGALVGAITYRVRCVDEQGNTGLSTLLGYTASAGCGAVSSYCTAGTSASGCQAVLAASGVPSLSAPSGFHVGAAGVEGNKDGLFFYGFQGGQINPWGNGTSFQCVAPPVKRTALLSGSGTAGACDGSFSADFNLLWFNGNPGKVPAAGQLVSLQLWYRDPQNPSNQTTSLSDGLQFSVCP